MPDRYRDRCRVVGGVDTHRDAHVAAALDPAGRLLGTASFPATRTGYEELGLWLRAWGEVDSVGVEGTSSYGAGVSRFLAAAGVTVVEVLRPRRRSRRGDKNDSADAVAAARSVLSGEATATPKSADGPVEAIRALRMARRSAVKARTVAMNQIKSLAVTASEQVTAPLRGRSSASLIKACSRLRPDPSRGEAAAAAKRSLRTLATRWQSLSAEIDELDAEITRLCAAAAPALLAAPGVGPQVAAALLVAAGDNPERLRSEASFAALCGVSPVEASSGRTVRHRLNRGGDRQANNALWRIATVRLRSDERTQAYAARRRAQGNTDREILRCLQ
ncbi:IS110 family transposase [Candidatus Poriferisodalis sp.]|uniref:IS110 family transposase n=1 Tax=Candidatus Poriferisodalis sp. TaxID=3101277 RepID=UPI003B524AC7